MVDRADEKARARAERLRVQEEAAAGAVRRKRRLRLVGVLLAAFVLLAIAIAVSSSRGPTTPPKPSNAAAAAVTRLLAGIPQTGNRLGRPSAPVTVTEYGDLECPICRDFALGAETRLIANDVRAGAVQLVYRSLQTATPDPATFATQQIAALAAGQQQREWDYIELFYAEQGDEGTGYVTQAYLAGLAGQIPGLDATTWRTARTSPRLAAEVQADEAEAASRNFDSTPTIVVAGPRGTAQPLVGDVDYPTLAQAVRQVS
jgi:protein-disulfide isomerase